MCPDGRRPFDLTKEEIAEYLTYWEPRWAQAYKDHKDDPPYSPPSDHSTTPDRYFPSPAPSDHGDHGDHGDRSRLFVPVPIPSTARPITPISPPRVNQDRKPMTTRSSVLPEAQFIELDSSPKATARESTFVYL
ncbi:MAG: hypothetical protein Q9201_007667, partial [Fulgogasparrea decipioides]